MTAAPSIDPEQFLHEQLAQASPDLMRQMLETFINTLLSAQADSVCGAEYAVRSPDRSNRHIHRPDPGVQVAVPVPVAPVRPVRAPHAVLGTAHAVRLRRQQRIDERLEHRAHQVR